MRNLHRNKPFLWGLLAAFLIIWFATLGSKILVPSDEARYAEMAREVYATGDWVTPRLNGIKYFEKPPLQNWVTAATFHAFGLGEWQARLWTGLTGLMGIFFAGYAGLRLYNARVGFYAALALAGTFYWSGAGHVNSLDMGLSGMMAIALCSLLLAQRKDASATQQRNWMLACWAGMALAVMSKGLIGVVLPGAVLVLYTLVSRDWAIWKRLHLIKGLIAFFAMTAPWFIAVSLRNPEFAEFFFIHEHFQRFTSKIHRREGPWYFFIPILLFGIIPWLGILGQSLIASVRSKEQPHHPFKPELMLLTWSVFIFVFFSMSSSKLVSYILPIFPALALLIAVYLDRASHKAIIISALVIGIPCVIGLFFVQDIITPHTDSYRIPLLQAHMPWIYAALLLYIGGAIVACLSAKNRPELAVTALALTSFLATMSVLQGHDPQGRYRAGYHHMDTVRAEITPQTKLYLVDQYEHAFPFYLERTFTLVNQTDEMAFGLQQEPQLWIPNIAGFVTVWTKDNAAGNKSLAIIRPSMYAQLKAQGLPMRVIGEDSLRVIVVTPDTK